MSKSFRTVMFLAHTIIPWLVVFLVLQTRSALTLQYNIVPDNSTCTKSLDGECYSLEEWLLSQNSYQYVNLTLKFSSGNYSLKQLIEITSKTNVNLIGQSQTIITCEQLNSGFYFYDIQSLNIENISITGCWSDNDSNGGAAYIKNVAKVTIKHCSFDNNQAINGNTYGGAIFLARIKTMYVLGSTFTDNYARGGGALYISNVEQVSIKLSTFIGNNAVLCGGAIGFRLSTIEAVFTKFNGNTVRSSRRIGTGGAINAYKCTVLLSHNEYRYNVVDNRGGALYIDNSFVSTTNSYFDRNKAKDGGAIYANGGQILNCTQNNYTMNTALKGGATFAEGNITVTGDRYAYNNATEGAAIYHINYQITITRATFTHNRVIQNGVIFLSSVSFSCKEQLTMVHNYGSVYSRNSQLEFAGDSLFSNNIGKAGGAIESINSKIYLNPKTVTIMHNNSATYGGAMRLTQDSSLYVYGALEIIDNNAAHSGGGINVYQSKFVVAIQSTHTKVLFRGNTALQEGGGLYASSSNIMISNSLVYFDANTASANGGAMFLAQNSIINLNKEQAENSQTISERLEFSHNTARKGGAIYIQDSTNTGILCEHFNPSTPQLIESTECFMQTLATYTGSVSYEPNKTNYINTFFRNNSATLGGNDIYGGLLDRCSVNPSAELVRPFPQYGTYTGLSYLKATVEFQDLSMYKHLAYPHHPNELTELVTKSDLKRSISSDPVQVCFCDKQGIVCNKSQVSHSVRKGEHFRISVLAIDQIGNPVPADVISTLTSNNAQLKSGQAHQQIRTNCTELEYNVYSTEDNASIVLYPDGPCRDMGISKRILSFTFLPCNCSLGLQPSSSDVECTCQCNSRIEPYVAKCSNDGEILLTSDIWIGYINESNNTGFIIHLNCPHNFCTKKPVSINLNTPDGIDKQCAFNRSGMLCGSCRDNLSMVFGSTHCEKCSDYSLFLIVPFALAGIALVAFIMILNLTVANGTIHGTILYANILAANHAVFVPIQTPIFLTVFISWLNLDLGIETCFYDGMDAYAEFLLQLVFPSYIFVLTILTIVLCEYSERFGKLLGKRNPVATLCTLILLSYSKLFQAIITALQYTYINYPNGSQEIAWLYDVKEPYFSTKQIPRFLAAFMIIILGVIYTILLFFGQWLPQCSNYSIMKWTENTKYTSFMDAYHASFGPKHRYWVGLLLLFRILHYIISAFADEPTIILSVSCITITLIMLKLFFARRKVPVYTKRLVSMFETVYLLNILLLSIGTFYVRETTGNQTALTTASMSTAFITFLCILVYHIYANILKGTKLFKKLQQSLAIKRKCRYQQLLEDEEEPLLRNESEDDNQLREPNLLDPVYTDNYREAAHPPIHHEPPMITFTVIEGRPNHKLVELIDPSKDK